MKRILFLVFCLVISNSAYAQAQEKLDNIDLLLQSLKESSDDTNVLAFYRDAVKEIPDEDWLDIISTLKQESTRDSLKKKISEKFTSEEIDELQKFYSSALNKKFHKEFQAILQESMMEQTVTNENLLKQIIEKVEQKGYSAEHLKKLLSKKQPLSP